MVFLICELELQCLPTPRQHPGEEHVHIARLRRAAHAMSEPLSWKIQVDHLNAAIVNICKIFHFVIAWKFILAWKSQSRSDFMLSTVFHESNHFSHRFVCNSRVHPFLEKYPFATLVEIGSPSMDVHFAQHEAI